MLEVFYGGMLFHPAGMDYSDETCSHACAYCFANINKAYREGDLVGAIKKLWRQGDTTYSGYLLSHGYPICVSNRTDAFAKNNIRNTRALFEHLAERDNGIFIQTKTGDGIGEVIESLPKKPVIYISITMLDEDRSKFVEVAAPLPSERLTMARYFIERGYVVVAAINPCSKTWLPPEDFDALTIEFKRIGIRHVVIEMLDMSDFRMRKIGTARKKHLGEAPATIGNEDRQYVRECTEKLVERGFMVSKKGMPYRSDFYVEVEAALGKTMPSLQPFVNACIDRGADEVTFGEFIEYIQSYINVDAPMQGNALRGYILRNSFDVWKDNREVGTLRDLMRICWTDHRHHLSIVNHTLFSAHPDASARDQDGVPLLMFNQPTKEGR